MASVLVAERARPVVDGLVECVEACEPCAQRCMRKPEMAECAELCLDCATLCAAAA